MYPRLIFPGLAALCAPFDRKTKNHLAFALPSSSQVIHSQTSIGEFIFFVVLISQRSIQKYAAGALMGLPRVLFRAKLRRQEVQQRLLLDLLSMSSPTSRLSSAMKYNANDSVHVPTLK